MTILDTPSAAAPLDVERFPTAVLPKATTPLDGTELAVILQHGTNVYIEASALGGGATVAGLAVSAGGNTAGVPGLVSTGTLFLAGGPNITLSQNGQSLSISAGVGGGASFSGGVSTGGNTLGNTGITGSQLVLAGVGNVTLSQDTSPNGGTISISAPAQSVQTQNLFDLTMSGNTVGAGALISSGTMTLAGGPNITLSQAGNVITISGASQSAESNTYGISNIGNTAGTSGVISGNQLRMLLAGGPNVTLSQSTNGSSATVSVSVAAQTAESQTFGMSNIGNTAGTSGVISGNQLRMLVVGGPNITVSQSTNASSATLSISAAPQSVQTQNLFALTISSNTAGVGALISSGTLTLAAGANITLSQNGGNAVTIIGPSPSGGAFSAGVSNLGNTAGSTGVSGTQLVLVGTNGISLSQSTGAGGATVSINFTQSAESQTFGMSNLGNSAGTSGVISGNQLQMLVVGGPNITVSQSTNASSATLSISAAAQTAESQTFGMSNIGNTAGTSGVISGNQLRMLVVGGPNITVSQSTNASSATLSISAAAQTAESQTFGMSNIGNTAGTSGVISGNQLQMLVVGGPNVTISQSTNASSATLSVSVAAQSQESQSIGASNLGNTLGTSGVASGAQVRAVIIATSNLTISQSVNGASVTQSFIANPPFVGGVSTMGNTGGATGATSTRLIFVGSNNITLSQTTDASGGTISIFGGAGGGAAGTNTLGISNLGNFVGTSGVITGSGLQFILAGGNQITLSQSINGSSATVTISAHPAFQAGVSTGGNTSGQTRADNDAQIVLVGSNNITLSQGTAGGGFATVTISGPTLLSVGISNLGNTAGTSGLASNRVVLVATGVDGLSQSSSGDSATVSFGESLTLSQWLPLGPIAYGAQVNDTNAVAHYAPVKVDRYYSASRIDFAMSQTVGSTGTITGTVSLGFGIYSRNGSTLSQLSTGSGSFGISFTGVQSNSSYNGLRRLTFSMNMNLTPGEYWIGQWVRTSGGQITVSYFVANPPTGGVGAAFSGDFGAASNATQQFIYGWGAHSASSTTLNDTVAFSHIVASQSTHMRNIWMQAVNFTL